MARTRFQLNRPALNAFVKTDPKMVGHLSKTANTLKAVSEANAPVKTGYFKKRFHVRPYRGGYRVYNRDPFAHLVEFGSINNPIYSPMRRAARSLGGRFVDPGPSTRAQDKFAESQSS